MIAIAYSIAQKKGPKYWIRVKNLKGAETLCTALGAFGVKIIIGSINAIKPQERSIHSSSSIQADIGLTAVAASPSCVNSASLSCLHTSIRFEYDPTGLVAIGICEAGGPVQDYIAPEEGGRKLSRNSMLIGELLLQIKLELGQLQLSFICKAAITIIQIDALAYDLFHGLEMLEAHGSCTSMRA